MECKHLFQTGLPHKDLVLFCHKTTAAWHTNIELNTEARKKDRTIVSFFLFYLLPVTGWYLMLWKNKIMPLLYLEDILNIFHNNHQMFYLLGKYSISHVLDYISEFFFLNNRLNVLFTATNIWVLPPKICIFSKTQSSNLTFFS